MVKIRELFRLILIFFRYFILTRVYKMNISRTARVSFGTILDKTHPRGIHIDDETYIASGTIVFSHDFSRGMKTNTYIGKRCFLGANAIIMPGIKIGDSVLVGAGAVVTKDVPSGCIVAGNPARILRENIKTERFGKIIE